MEQLLKITSIPIKIEVKVTRAQLKTIEETPPVNVSEVAPPKKVSQAAPSVKVLKDKDGFQVKADPIKVNIDSTSEDSTSFLKKFDTFTKSDEDNNNEFILSYEAIAKFSQDSTQKPDDTSASISNGMFAAEKQFRSIENVLDYLPKGGNDISWNDGKLSVTYSSKENSFDWESINSPKYEFIPGSIELIVKEMPRIDIEYVGDPIYFPRSADPNYEPIVDVRV